MSFVNPSIRRSFFGYSGDSHVGFGTDVRPNEVPLFIMITKDEPAYVPSGSALVTYQQFGNMYFSVLKFDSENTYRSASFGTSADYPEETFGAGFLYVLDGVDPVDTVLDFQITVVNSSASTQQVNFPSPDLEEGVGKVLWMYASSSEPFAHVPQGSAWSSDQNYPQVFDQVVIHNAYASGWGSGVNFNCTEKIGVIDFEEQSAPTRSAWVSEDDDAILLTLTLRSASAPDPEEPEEPDETGCEQACSKQIVININCCK